MSDVVCEVQGRMGLITLDRPQALNALSLPMVRELTQALLAWEPDSQVEAVAIRGMSKAPGCPSGRAPFGVFCAGGDIRFFHQAALAGDPRIDDFFTEEYALDHLVHRYAKPYVAFLDGIVMGGGMGIAGHGGPHSLRIVTERTRMAMPETQIGLFPDVGGGWFLARCPGRLGEYLALTGQVFGGADALALGLADLLVDSAELPALWARVAAGGAHEVQALAEAGRALREAPPASPLMMQVPDIDRFFALPSVGAIVTALEGEGAAGHAWACETANILRKRSPLMLHVVLEQVRRARRLGLADELRMERGMVRQCFGLRPGAASETVEGIRALAVDKDHAPRWNPARIEDVTPDLVEAFFASPWPAHAHPLRAL